MTVVDKIMEKFDKYNHTNGLYIDFYDHYEWNANFG
jgi:hypothetical protein